jgi:hypothetical protein
MENAESSSHRPVPIKRDVLHLKMEATGSSEMLMPTLYPEIEDRKFFRNVGTSLPRRIVSCTLNMDAIGSFRSVDTNLPSYMMSKIVIIFTALNISNLGSNTVNINIL